MKISSLNVPGTTTQLTNAGTAGSFDLHLKPSNTIEYESHGAYIIHPLCA